MSDRPKRFAKKLDNDYEYYSNKANNKNKINKRKIESELFETESNIKKVKGKTINVNTINNSDDVETAVQKLEESIANEEVIVQGVKHEEEEENVHVEPHQIVISEGIVVVPNNNEKANSELISSMLDMEEPNDAEVCQQIADELPEIGTECIEIPMRRKKANKKLKTKGKNVKDSPVKDDPTADAAATTGHERVECEQCHKFLKPNSYKQHLKTHSGLKPYKCSICAARFSRKGDVDRHVRIVHEKEKPFQCPTCSKHFADKKNLKLHVNNHDKKLFFVCDTCGFKFGKRDYYENHIKYIHPIGGGDTTTDDVDNDTPDDPLEGTSSASQADLVQTTSYIIKQGDNVISVVNPSSQIEEHVNLTDPQIKYLIQKSNPSKIITKGNEKRGGKNKSKRKQNLMNRDDNTIQAFVINMGDTDNADDQIHENFVLINDDDDANDKSQSNVTTMIDALIVAAETSENNV